MLNVRVAVATAALLLAGLPAQAQDQPAGAADAGSAVHGSFDVGYRWRSVEGSADSFRQLFDVTQGLRVLGVDLHGVMAKDADRVADTFDFTASGLGGDPFPTLQFTMSKARRYRLRVNWRRSRFFNVAPLTPDAIGGFDTRVVTDAHSWTTERQIGNAAWTFDVSNRLHLLVSYDRVVNDGSLDATRSLEYPGASSVWASFARANPYAVFGPVDNTSNRATAGLSYVRDRWTLNYQAGLRGQTENQTFAPLAANQRSINVVEATTAGEPLTALRWSQHRSLKAPSSDLLFVARPSSKIEWRSRYTFFRYRGPFELDADYAGIARTNNGGTAYAPYSIVQATAGTATSPTHILEQGLTWRPAERWAFDATYRYSHSANTADATLESVAVIGGGAPASTREHVVSTWRNRLQSLGLGATWSPVAALTVRPGVRLTDRDVLMREDDVVEAGATRREQAVAPEITVGYRPNQWFSARGSYQTYDSDTSYTRLSPVERSTARVVLHVAPRPDFSVEASANRVDAELTDASYISHTRSGAVSLAYDVSERLALSGGFDYQSFLGTGDGSFIRGTAPLANLALNDRRVDRVWQGGFSIRPTPAFGIIASGNFARTTGLDQIFGEPALYGPISFPYVTGTVYYDLPRVGKIAAELQRTSLAQEILSLNDFRANLVTLRYSRTF